MKVVVAGAGAVGSFLADDLARSGHEVLLVEKRPETMERQPGDTAVTLLAADACEVDTLHRAGVEEADVVVAATGDDEDNLVISLLSKQEFAVPRVIARVNHPKNHWLFNETWGVDVAVSTPHLLSALVEEAVSVNSLVSLLHFAGGSTGLVEITLVESSPAIDVSIADLGMPRGATVVAVVREESVVVPHGDTTLAAGDEVLLLVTADCEDEVRGLFVTAP